MWMSAITVALLLAQASAPAAAPATTAQAAPADASAAKPEKPKKPKLICTEEEQMGSYMKRRVCRTPETVEADRKSAERMLRSCQGPGC